MRALASSEVLGGENNACKRILITGGAGFIGCNAAFFGTRNWKCRPDNLRARWREESSLVARCPLDFEGADIRNRGPVVGSPMAD
jgi:nucleoside-diphosphate-sugar epimerase